MTEVLATVRYLTDANREKTDVVVPLETWQALVKQLEDQEDRALIQDWLNLRKQGAAYTVSLAELKQELRTDGLLLG
jgi:hypothetical protein